jgi:hypothetical protein
MKRTYTLKTHSNQHSNNTKPKTSLKKSSKKRGRSLRGEKDEDCNRCEESKEHYLNEDDKVASQEDDKSLSNKFYLNPTNPSLMNMCGISMSYPQQFIIPEPAWSLNETLILSLFLYKTRGELGQLVRMFPGRDVYKHVITSLALLAHNIKYNSYTEYTSAQIHKLELTIYTAMLLNAIQRISSMQEILKIAQDFRLTDKECFEFLSKMHTGVKFNEEVFQEFLESMMEDVENKVYELTGHTGNLKDLMNFKGGVEERSLMFQSIPGMQYYSMPYMNNYGLFSFYCHPPMSFSPIHL